MCDECNEYHDRFIGVTWVSSEEIDKRLDKILWEYDFEDSNIFVKIKMIFKRFILRRLK